MNILIVAATKPELNLFLNNFNFEFIPEKEIYWTKIKNNEIHVLISGIGIAFTSYKLTKFLAKAQKKYDLIINAGIAGSFDRSLKLGEVVNIVEDEFADLGIENAEGRILTIFESAFADKNEFPFTNGKLLNNNNNLFGLTGKIKKVSGITVNTTHGLPKNILKFEQKYKARTESMEGAAVFYIAMNEKIPVLQIRSISNYVEKRNKANWKIKEAVQNLNKFLIKFITNNDSI